MPTTREAGLLPLPILEEGNSVGLRLDHPLPPIPVAELHLGLVAFRQHLHVGRIVLAGDQESGAALAGAQLHVGAAIGSNQAQQDRLRVRLPLPEYLGILRQP
jgi:hypothetical protein